MVAPKLFEYRLPARDIKAINIGWFRNSAEIQLDWRTWIGQGYDGIRIIGAGIDRSLIHGNLYDGTAVAIGRHPGITQLENLSIYAGFSMGVQCGEQNLTHELVPKFMLKYLGVKGFVTQIPGFGRTKWWDFGYQRDVTFEDVEIDAIQASEHGSYSHGFAKLGLHAKRLKFRGSGAQNLKVRSSADETAYAGPQAKIHIEDSTFQRWFQEWSDRGGGGIVIEGGAAIVEIQDSIFRGGGDSSQHARCIMLSSESNSYDWATGKVGVGAGNGPVTLKRLAISGRAPDFWGNELVRCGRNGGTQLSAASFLMEACGGYGKNMIVQLGQLPKGKGVIRSCNTPEIREKCSLLGGIDVDREAVWPGPARLVPLSEGVVV